MKTTLLKEMNEVTEEYSRGKQIQQINNIAKEVASQLIASAERVSSDKASRDIIQTNLDDLLDAILDEIELADWEVNLPRDYFGEGLKAEVKRKLNEGAAYNPTFDASTAKFLVKNKNGEYVDRSGYSMTDDIQRARLFGTQAVAKKFVNEKEKAMDNFNEKAKKQHAGLTVVKAKVTISEE